MKASEIQKGGKYVAKVSGVLTTVRVDEIREVGRNRMNHYSGRLEYTDRVVYDVTNLKTGRRTTFKSAAKFRRAVIERTPESIRLERAIRQLSDEAHRGVITKEQHDEAFDKLIRSEADARGIQLPQASE